MYTLLNAAVNRLEEEYDTSLSVRERAEIVKRSSALTAPSEEDVYNVCLIVYHSGEY